MIDYEVMHMEYNSARVFIYAVLRDFSEHKFKRLDDLTLEFTHNDVKYNLRVDEGHFTNKCLYLTPDFATFSIPRTIHHSVERVFITDILDLLCNVLVPEYKSPHSEYWGRGRAHDDVKEKRLAILKAFVG